jgi:hypothetical protein
MTISLTNPKTRLKAVRAPKVPADLARLEWVLKEGVDMNFYFL